MGLEVMHRMENGNKDLGATIAQALSVLPEHKKEYIIGYAEGVAAMAARMAAKAAEAAETTERPA